MFNIAIIIPIHNRLELTIKGLEAIKRSIKFAQNNSVVSHIYEIVVIDDGSTDGSYKWISSNHPDIHLLTGDGNLWWSGAVNNGVNFAIRNFDSSFIVILNPDTIPKEDYFYNLSQCLNQGGKKIIGSRVLDIKTNSLLFTLKSFNRYTGLSRNITNDQIAEQKWVTGMGMVVPTLIFKQIGFFDAKQFPQYFGDIDFCLRASTANFNVSASNKLVIYNRTEFSSFIGHDMRTIISSLKSSNLNSRYNFKIRYKFFLKHCVYPFWIFTLILYYTKYIITVLFRKG